MKKMIKIVCCLLVACWSVQAEITVDDHLVINSNLTVHGSVDATIEQSNVEGLVANLNDLQQQVENVYSGGNSVTVKVTDNPVVNGSRLIAAYQAAAERLVEIGIGEQRVAVIIPPAHYDVGQGFAVDAPGVDFIGQTPDRETQYIYGATTVTQNWGVIVQLTDNVRFENLTFHKSNSNSVIMGIAGVASAAYFPWGAGSNTVFRNCIFSAVDGGVVMRMDHVYAGHYEDCMTRGSLGSFAVGSVACGTFIRCEGDNFSFGGSYGDACGTFIDCKGGEGSFGGEYGTKTNGIFVNCSGGDDAFDGIGPVTNYNFNLEGYKFHGGPISGDGSGLVNLQVVASKITGALSTDQLPTSGTWNAAGVTVSNLVVDQDVDLVDQVDNQTIFWRSGDNTIYADVMTPDQVEIIVKEIATQGDLEMGPFVNP